jgi:hypothetical protein
VVGEQRSDFWDRPNLSGAAPGTLAAWRRRETLWVSPHTGYAVAVERVIERRLAGPEPDGPRLTARFELHSEARYPGQLSDDRRREIRQALAFAEQLATADRRSDTALDVILRRIDRYEDSAQPTPYRVAVEEVRRRAEGYRKGQDPPARTPVEVPTAGLTPGKPAPDFVTMDLARREPWRLGRERGKPVLLLFYDPLAPSAPNVLREARTVRDRLGGRVAAAAVPVRGEEAAILKQRAEVRVDLPVLTREPLPAVYQPPATPRWLILDAGGDLRHASTGWGAETGDVLRAELEACLPRTGK